MIAPLDPAAFHAPGHALPPGGLALDTVNLTKRFGAFTALDDVSLSVRPGTVHALLGENGAGKSTLVKCVVGYQPPSTGSVVIDGREWPSPPPPWRAISASAWSTSTSPWCRA
jgi:ABC-type uncharacterized transport system ATPase subunit